MLVVVVLVAIITDLKARFTLSQIGAGDAVAAARRRTCACAAVVIAIVAVVALLLAGRPLADVLADGAVAAGRRLTRRWHAPTSMVLPSSQPSTPSWTYPSPQRGAAVARGQASVSSALPSSQVSFPVTAESPQRPSSTDSEDEQPRAIKEDKRRRCLMMA